MKLIDFGLALRRGTRETRATASAATILGSSVAGTLEYAAPEQMGKLPGVAVSPASDVYGFAKTCCYAVFQTPQPLPRHWRSLPPPLAELLEECLEEQPERRPRGFGAVLDRLSGLGRPAPPPPTAVPLPLAQAAPPPVSAVPASDLTPEQRQQELAALAQRVSACTRCAQLPSSRTRTVFGVGPLDPDVLFVGEAPGADEDRAGEPFVGAAGQLFNGLLRDLGVRREDVYIANMLKCRPPNNRTPYPQEVNNCREYLNRQIELVRPKLICALGGCAAQNLLGTTEPIGRLRRSFRDYRGIPVLCTYHPAFLLPGRSPERRRDVLDDLRLLLRRLGR